MMKGEISRVGFGGYRISEHNVGHHAAIELALESGCNLFDTAPNYGDGEFERSIGKVIASSRRTETFVITKVGYAGKADGDFFGSCNGRNALKSTKRIDGESLHCLHPHFIEFKVHSSLRNLQTDYLDAVLVHNPEYQLDSEFGDILGEAFATLDGFVKRGIIGCYGVSSNILPQQNDLTLDCLIELATGVGSGSRFKIVQFPFNLAEWDANSPQGKQSSLLASARASGITTIANRPLNARTTRGAIRLFEDHERVTFGNAFLTDFLLLLGKVLSEQGIDGDINDLSSVAKFKRALEIAIDPQALGKLFNLTFDPILRAAFSERIPGDLIFAMRTTFEMVQTYTRQRMTRAALAFAQQPEIAERTKGVRGDTLQVVACQAILDAGANHVLVGMRQPKYVKQFQHLFSTP